MHQLKHQILPVAFAAALAGCGGAESPEELAEVVVSRLQESDFPAYLEDAVATPKQVLEVCPDKSEYALDQARHQEHFDECLRRYNFASAEISKVIATHNTAVSCGPEVGSTQEILVTVVNDQEILTFKIKSALQTADGWLATGTLDCPGK